MLLEDLRHRMPGIRKREVTSRVLDNSDFHVSHMKTLPRRRGEPQRQGPMKCKYRLNCKLDSAGRAPPARPRDAKCPLLVSDVLLSHGLLRSTIGARGLNFRVRNGTGCASPAMVADQQGAFCCQGRLRAVPWGPHSVTSDALSGSLGPDEEEKSSAD